MTNILKKYILILFLVFCYACSPEIQTPTKMGTRAVDKEAILNVYSTWNEAVEAGDRNGVLSVLHNKIRMVPQSAPDIVGIEAYGEFLIPVFNNASYKIINLSDWDIEFIGNDIAQVRYDYIIEITLKSKTKLITESKATLSKLSNNLKYNDLVVRGADGQWKVLMHMWNAGYERAS
jgi:ketosteroid isomerase-like protein